MPPPYICFIDFKSYLLSLDSWIYWTDCIHLLSGNEGENLNKQIAKGMFLPSAVWQSADADP
jgi:hypothetical protein